MWIIWTETVSRGIRSFWDRAALTAIPGTSRPEKKGGDFARIRGRMGKNENGAGIQPPTLFLPTGGLCVFNCLQDV